MARYMKIKPADNFLDKYSMKSFEIDSLSVYSEKKIIELHLKINNYNADREIEDLRKLLYKSFGNELTLRVEYDIKPELIRENVIGYVKFNIENYKFESERYRYLFANYEVDNIEKILYIKLPAEHMVEEVNKSPIVNRLSSKISEVFDDEERKVELTTGDFEELRKNLAEHFNNLEKPVEAKYIPKTVPSNQNQSKSTTSYNKSKYRSNTEDIKASPFSALEYLNAGEDVALEGKIFGLEIKKTKNGNLMYDFLITDYSDSISCRIFLKPDEDLEIKVGDWVKVIGIFEADRFTQEYIINTKRVDKIPSKDVKRVDNAEKKRVELHAHTNMSEMSGVMSAKDLAKRAKEFGHSAVAVTDFGVVHSYPFAYKEATEDFKIIFGIEAYVVDDEQEMITKPKDIII